MLYTARACNGACKPEALEGSFDGLRKYGEILMIASGRRQPGRLADTVT